MTDSDLLIDLRHSPDGAGVTVVLAGEVDASNSHLISAVVTVVAGWAETRHVVVDLGGVDFLDSTGVGALSLCRYELRVHDVSFEVIGAQGVTLRVLEMTGWFDFLSSPSSRPDRPPVVRSPRQADQNLSNLNLGQRVRSLA